MQETMVLKAEVTDTQGQKFVSGGGQNGPWSDDAACLSIGPMKKFLFLATLVFLGSCAGNQDLPFDLRVEPDFVQGVIPGENLVLLASVSDTEAPASEVALAVEAIAGEVGVDPDRVTAGEVAEVTYVANPISGEQEQPITVTITASRGSQSRTHEISTVVVPWEDTLAATASDILAVFRPWLAANRPDLGINEETEFEGTFVAPNLLVVSHYAYFNQDWELGLSWHIMVAPDDWAQLYLRPRSVMSPTQAFQLDSWSTALNGGLFQITEITPPEQVVR